MPAVEADVEVNEKEIATYELAFHVLPTIAEGEVETVFQKLKDIIAKKGEVTIEEAPAHFDLAYEIIKHLEGRNRKFTSAYFGWVRFTAKPAEVEALTEEIEGVDELLRHLLTKLTKLEDANPFYFHEALEEKRIENIEVDDKKAVVKKKPEVKEEAKEEVAEETKEEVKKEDGEADAEKV